MFELFLDPTMMYSCAYYPDEKTSLEQASLAKLQRICDKLQLNESDHVIEIGTGWGGFALYAAQNYGCKVTTTTISQQQHDWACVGASTLIALVLLFVGPQGAWAFVAFAWTQALLATYFGYTTVNSDWAEVEGVKATAEGYIAPIFFLVVNTILLFNMSDILYVAHQVQ